MVCSGVMREGWRRNLYVIWIVAFTSISGGSMVQPFLPLFIYHDLGVGDPSLAAFWSGLAISAGGIAQGVMAPFWGIMADRHGRKAMVVRAQFGIFTANTLLSMVGSPSQLVAIRSLQGAFSGIVGALRALVAGTVPRERVPYAMGLLQSAIFMGQTLGPSIGGVLASGFGYRVAFIGTAVINLLAGILAAAYVKEDAAARGAARRGEKGGVWTLLRSRYFATLIVMFCLTSLGSAVWRPFLPLLLQELDPAHDVAFSTGLAFTALGMSGAIAAVVATRGHLPVGLRGLVVLAAGGGGALTLGIAFASTPLIVLGLLLFIGLAQGTIATAGTALISMAAPASRQGTAFGMVAAAQSLAQGVGPISGGLLVLASDVRVPFVVSGAMMLIGALLALTVQAPPGTGEGEPAVG